MLGSYSTNIDDCLWIVGCGLWVAGCGLQVAVVRFVIKRDSPRWVQDNVNLCSGVTGNGRSESTLLIKNRNMSSTSSSQAISCRQSPKKSDMEVLL